MKLLLSIFVFAFLLLLSSCEKDDIILLKGCCGNEPINQSVGNAHLYVPNIFTPNDDGINDLFLVLGDSIRSVISLEIKDLYNQLVYRADDVQANDYSEGWNGEVNGSVRKGLYGVFLTIEAEDGTIESFESYVCNFPCGEANGEELESIKDCQFPFGWLCRECDGCCSYLDYTECFE